MKIKCALIVLIISLPLANVHAESEAHKVLQNVAQASGLGAFDQVERLNFTFIAEIGEREITRAWAWSPKAERVVFQPGSEGAVRYQRADVDGRPELRAIDQKFVNDLYWLIFPFTVAWDATVDLEVILPDQFSADIEAEGGLRVIYPEGVGYTPGDVYEIYYDEANLVSAWVFRKGGSVTPTRVTTWENYQTIGPLTLSLERPAPTGDFRISFEKVSIE